MIVPSPAAAHQQPNHGNARLCCQLASTSFVHQQKIGASFCCQNHRFCFAKIELIKKGCNFGFVNGFANANKGWNRGVKL